MGILLSCWYHQWCSSRIIVPGPSAQASLEGQSTPRNSVDNLLVVWANIDWRTVKYSLPRGLWMVVTSRGIVSLKNFELMSRLYKGLCSGLLCSRQATATLLLQLLLSLVSVQVSPDPHLLLLCDSITHLQCTLSLPFPYPGTSTLVLSGCSLI